MLPCYFFKYFVFFLWGRGEREREGKRYKSCVCFILFEPCLKQPFVGCILGNDSSCTGQTGLEDDERDSEVKDAIDECKWSDSTSSFSSKPRERLVFEISLGRSRYKVGHFRR